MSTINSVWFNQYLCISDIRRQVDKCIQDVSEQNKLTADLSILENLIKDNLQKSDKDNNLFIQKSTIISIFKTPLPQKIQMIIDEANKISALKEQLLSIHHRAS